MIIITPDEYVSISSACLFSGMIGFISGGILCGMAVFSWLNKEKK